MANAVIRSLIDETGRRIDIFENWHRIYWQEFTISDFMSELPRQRNTGLSSESGLENRKRKHNRRVPEIRECMRCKVNGKTKDECLFESYYGDRICSRCHYEISVGTKRLGSPRVMRRSRHTVLKPALTGR